MWCSFWYWCFGNGLYTLSTTTATVVTIPKASTLTLADKCTWVAVSYVYAPTFKMSNGTDDKGLATGNWNIHHMEYMTSSGNTNWDAKNGLLL